MDEVVVAVDLIWFTEEAGDKLDLPCHCDGIRGHELRVVLAFAFVIKDVLNHVSADLISVGLCLDVVFSY